MSSQAASAPPLDEMLCFAIYATGFAFNRIYRKPLARLGLTYPQFLVMTALWSEDGATVGGLGEKLCLDSSTLTPLLKRLESVGLLTRRRAQDDERRVIVRLTEAGSALRTAAAEALRCVFSAADLTPEAFAKLTREIHALRRNLERSAAG